MTQKYLFPIAFLLFLSISFTFVESVALKHQNKEKKSHNKCNNNCQNPVYIQSRLGKYLDVAYDIDASEVICFN